MSGIKFGHIHKFGDIHVKKHSSGGDS